MQGPADALIGRLALDDIRWRTEAEDGLVALGDAAIEPLISAVKDPRPAVRFHAARALTRFAEKGHDARVLPHLVPLLGDAENNGAVAIVAEKLLVHLGQRSVAALLGTARDATKPQGVRARAVRALGKIGGAPLEALGALLGDPDPAVRAQAATASGTIAAASSEDAIRERTRGQLRTLLEDPELFVRHAAAEQLVALQSAAGRAVLEAAQTDPDDQHWARDLLERLDDLQRSGELKP